MKKVDGDIALAKVEGRNTERAKIVALDDGHGMETPGKQTPKFPDGSFMHENEFNRAVVQLAAMDLLRHGINVVLTAPGDNDVPLKDRVKTANDAGVDLFISIHANAMDDKWGDASGIEIYHYPGSVNGKRAAEIIYKHLIQGTPLQDRGVKTAGFYVLKYTKMPAVLCECGFMDNLQEAKLLLTGAYRAECAREITAGICEYFGIEYIVLEPEMDYKSKYENLVKELEELVKKHK